MPREQSVLLVTSTDPTNQRFGTSFFIGRDSSSVAYAVTCAHVVRDVGGPETVRVGSRPARVIAIGSPGGADDLAVLAVEVDDDAMPLPLGRPASADAACSVIGYRKAYGNIRQAIPIDVVLKAGGLSTDGRLIAGWSLQADEAVPEGYSGSPVIGGKTKQVVGVVSLSFLNHARAVAVSADEVTKLWPAVARLVVPGLTYQGVEFVYVPAGWFAMGTQERRAKELAQQRNRAGFLDEAPRTELVLDAFYIARQVVTNEQYQQFVNTTREPVPFRSGDPWSSTYSWDRDSRHYPDGLGDHPVVLVSWSAARRYCVWLGARLPTEAEWEKAARGADGRTWPWGDEWRADACNNSERSTDMIAPVGSFSPMGDSPYGAHDMSGNVWEWCSSLSDPYPYDPDDGREDGGADGNRVIRGGAFEQDRYMARCATRNSARQDDLGFTIGFRVALSPGNT